MDIPNLHRSAAAGQVPIERLAKSQTSSSEKLAEASRQFEAVLLRQILTEAQKPVFKSKAALQSVSGDIYRDMITNQLADQISRSGAIGLGRSLETQLQHQLKPADKPAGTTPPGQSGLGQPPNV